jgi:equilibrative nucleoside transporter 1/2/3
LGDSTYQKFNFAAKKLYRRLLQLGALPILDLALADEQHLLGIDEIFEKWSTDLLENVPFFFTLTTCK